MNQAADACHPRYRSNRENEEEQQQYSHQYNEDSSCRTKKHWQFGR